MDLLLQVWSCEMRLAQALGSEGEKEVGALSGGGGAACEICSGRKPTNHFFFVGGHQAQASGVGCSGFVLPPAAPYLGWGGTGEGKSPFPSFSVVLAASCQTIDRALPPLRVPSWDLMSAFHTAAFGSIIPASYQGQEPLSVSHWLCGIDLETS